MKFYFNLFDKKSLITDQDILNSYRKQGKGINTKHFVSISGIERQVYSESQVKNNQLCLDGVKITNSEILASYKKKGRGPETEHYVEIDGQEKRVFTLQQLYKNQLFLDGVKITDHEILATYKKKGSGSATEHFVEIDGQEKRVFTSQQLYNNKLFLDGVKITDPEILATHRKQGRGPETEHYVEIDGQEKRVFTSVQLSSNRLFLDGNQITDPEILATYKKKSGSKNKHYVEIDGEEKPVLTASLLSKNRLFFGGVQITNPDILATHRKKRRGSKSKHYVEIDGQEERVFTLKQLGNKKLFLNSEQITDPEILATYMKQGKGPEAKHFVTIQDLVFEVKKYREPMAETLNNQVYPGTTEIEKPAVESNLDASSRMSNSNPPGAEENSNRDMPANAIENQNAVDVADHAAQTFFDDTDGESFDQTLNVGTIIDNLMNNMISTSNQVSGHLAQPSNFLHPTPAFFNSAMFFASQARSQNVSNDRSQDLTTTSIYDQQKNCLKAMANWLHATNLDVIQQQYTSCPAPIIRFKSDIASLCATVIDSVLTRLIPEDMLTQENLLKLRYIKAFQYNSATPFDHQCLDRFIKCVENKRNSLNQPSSQTIPWKSNLR